MSVKWTYNFIRASNKISSQKKKEKKGASRNIFSSVRNSHMSTASLTQHKAWTHEHNSSLLLDVGTGPELCGIGRCTSKCLSHWVGKYFEDEQEKEERKKKEKTLRQMQKKKERANQRSRTKKWSRQVGETKQTGQGQRGTALWRGLKWLKQKI